MSALARRIAGWRSTLVDHPIVRSTGRSNWLLGMALGLLLGTVLIGGIRLDRTDFAARIGLGIILVSLPSIPATFRAAAGQLAARAAAVVGGALVAGWFAGNQYLVGAGVLICAAAGAFLPKVRVTAALAVLLCGLRVELTGPAEIPGLGESIGAVAVLLVGAGSSLIGRLGGGRPADDRPATATPAADNLTAATPATDNLTTGNPAADNLTTGNPAADRRSRRRRWWADNYPHAVRMAVAIGTAIAVAWLSGAGLYSAHWLITAVLLSMQRTGPATRLRVAQRLLGNTFGALLVALIMAAGPSAPVLAVVAAGLYCVAFSLRSRSYLWWAVTAPPVLLIVGDFPLTHGWYEGGIRVALGVVGAIIVLGVYRLLPEQFRRG